MCFLLRAMADPWHWASVTVSNGNTPEKETVQRRDLSSVSAASTIGVPSGANTRWDTENEYALRCKRKKGEEMKVSFFFLIPPSDLLG